MAIRLTGPVSGACRSSSGTAGTSETLILMKVSVSRVIAAQSSLSAGPFCSSLTNSTPAVTSCGLSQSRPRRCSHSRASGLHLDIEIEHELTHSFACDRVNAREVFASAENLAGESHLRCFRNK
jgi:hypothetical protein